MMDDTLQFEVEPELTAEQIEEVRNVVKKSEQAIATREPSINEMLATITNQANALDRVAVMERLIAMKNAEEDRAARMDFERQFAKLRQALPVIKKTKEVTTRSGRRMYEYAPLEEIQEACDKIIADHGFAYAWRTEPVEGAIRVWFDLFGYGHTRSNFNDIPTLKPITSREGEAVTNDAQATRGTIAYGKRGSMVDGLGLRIEGEDADGRVEIDDAVEAIFTKIANAKTDDELMNIYKIAAEQYKDKENTKMLIYGKCQDRRRQLREGK